jgi:hypothetical protein
MAAEFIVLLSDERGVDRGVKVRDGAVERNSRRRGSARAPDARTTAELLGGKRSTRTGRGTWKAGPWFQSGARGFPAAHCARLIPAGRQIRSSMQTVRSYGGRALAVTALASALFACGDSSGPDGGEPTGIATVGGNGQSGRVGAPLAAPIVAEVRDGSARGVAGVSVTFSVTSGGGTVDPAVVVTDGQGRASATWTLGTSTSQEQRVRVRLTEGASQISAQFQATPEPDAASALAKTVGDGQTRAAGVALLDSLAVRAQDRFGNPVPGVSVSWTTLSGGGGVSPATSVTGADGVARTQWTMGGQAGTNTAQAAAQGLTPVVFSAEAVPPPVITSVAPDTLRPGQAATLSGANFSALAADNIVRVNNTIAVLQSVTANQVTFTVPCETTGVAQVALATNGASAERAHPLSGGDPLILAVGQVASLGPTQLGCNELSADGARYLIAVSHNVATGGTSTSFRVRGATAGAGVPAVVTSAGAGLRVDAPAGSFARARAAVPGLRDKERHMRLLEAGERLIGQMGSAARPQRARSGITAQAAAQTIQVGDTLSLRIPDIDAGNLCTTKTTVRARAIHVGTHGVVLEDVAAPLAAQMDSAYRAIGDEFETVQYPILRANFGDPLAYDASTDANGKFFMLFSKVINDFGDVAGFVSPADLLSTNSCASSNEAEIFYGVVPTDAARGFPPGGSEDTQDEWRWSMRSVILHEAKHITANAERFQRTTGSLVTLEESWLEEATAMIAEELYGRAVFGYRQNGNTGFDESVYCERRPDPSRHPQQCWNKPVIMLDHFFYVYQYMRSPETLTPLGRLNSDDSDATFYGSGWSLVRWLTDHFAPSESAFLSALIQEPTLRGLTNLSAKLGREIGPLIGDWALALALDDDPSFTPTDPIHSLPSWNLRSVYAGLNGDGWSGTNPFPDTFPRGARTVSFGTFDVTVPAVRGGSAALVELTGPRTGRQLLEVTSTGSTNNLYMKVVRVE